MSASIEIETLNCFYAHSKSASTLFEIECHGNAHTHHSRWLSEDNVAAMAFAAASSVIKIVCFGATLK